MRFLTNPNILALLSLFIISIFALKDLAKPGFYTSHDGETHTARIAAYYKGLKDGQIPPRFAGDFYNGLGSPIFVYIYPVPYILGSLSHLLGFNFANSFKILMALGFFFAGLSCYIWLKEVFKSRHAAVLGAFFYIIAPYRLLLIYVRGSLSENIAYIFLPLTLFAVTKYLKVKTTFYLALTSISFALLLLSQNLVAIMSTPVIIGYSLVLIASTTEKIKNTSVVIASLLIGLALASFTYLPSFFERKYIKFDSVIGTTFGDHFLSFKQVLYSAWGYGFDLPGTVNDSISLQLGLAHWLVILLTFLALGYSIIRNKADQHIKTLLFFIITFAITIFLMVKSEPGTLVWESVRAFKIIDIPWRLLGISTLTVAFFAAYLVSKMRLGILFVVLAVAVLVANRNHIRINETINHSDAHFLDYSGHATYYSEFIPIWRDRNSNPESIKPNEKYKLLEGDALVQVVKADSHELELNTTVKSDSAKIRINKSYFPTTEVLVDGELLINFQEVEIPAKVNPNEDAENIGLLLLPLQKGTHEIAIRFTNTQLRRVANIISLVTLLGCLALLTKFRNVKIN